MLVMTNCDENDDVDERMLWDFLAKQHEFILDQFNLAIIGIGALFLVYLSADRYKYLQLLVALIGIAASVIISLHTYGANKEAHSINEELRSRSVKKIFFTRYESIRLWRNSGWDKHLYYPVMDTIFYFTVLMTVAWLSILLYTISLVYEISYLNLENIIVIDLIIGFIVIGIAIYKHYT